MTPLQIANLIEFRRNALEEELQLATGTDVQIQAHVHSLGETSRAIVHAVAGRKGWKIEHTKDLIWANHDSKNKSSIGHTAIFVLPRKVSK